MATHGVVSKEYPHGALQLAGGKFLTAKAILDAFGKTNLMKARLTVISTCKSGLFSNNTSMPYMSVLYR